MSASTRDELRLEAQELMLNYTPGSMVYDVASALLAYMEREEKVESVVGSWKAGYIPPGRAMSEIDTIAQDAAIKAAEEGR